MANEYMVYTEDMVLVADAIRTKNNINNLIIWPQGYIDAIAAIQTGGGLNFSVVGGITQPENPTQNTIWVQTEYDINEWLFSSSKPENVVNGTVWIRIIESGNYKFNALTENTIEIIFGTVQQYNNNVWETIPTYIYQNGQWIECTSRKYLIEDGITEYEIENSYYGRYYEGDGYITLGTGEYGDSAIWISDIDLTDFDIIVLKGAFDEDTCLRIWDSSKSPGYKNEGSATVTLDPTSNVAFLDIESFSGIYKIGISYGGGKQNQISDLYLAGGGDI